MGIYLTSEEMQEALKFVTIDSECLPGLPLLFSFIVLFFPATAMCSILAEGNMNLSEFIQGVRPTQTRSSVKGEQELYWEHKNLR